MALRSPVEGGDPTHETWLERFELNRLVRATAELLRKRLCMPIPTVTRKTATQSDDVEERERKQALSQNDNDNGRGSYVFVTPWELGRPGGVDQVVLNLFRQFSV